MAVYRPTYRDPKTGKLKQSSVWWYRFRFAGRHIRESSKSERKTIAKDAETNRRAELEKSFNGVADKRSDRIRTVSDLANEFYARYELMNPDSKETAHYILRHIHRLLGKLLRSDVSVDTVKTYQTTRLKEKAAPNSINKEVVKLFQILGDQGDPIRAKMRRERSLHISARGGETTQAAPKAYTTEEKARMLAAAKTRHSPAIYPSLVLALNAGMRDGEIKKLTWGQVDLGRGIVTVGEAKTDAGTGRTIPLNSDALAALVAHAKWYLGKFGATDPSWFVFPFGKTYPQDPTRHVVSFRTVWANVKTSAGVTGRFHDARHTFITNLAESGEAGDETIRDMAGHVSKQMLKHYSHIGMQAKRRAVEALATKPIAAEANAVVKETVTVDAIN